MVLQALLCLTLTIIFTSVTASEQSWSEYSYLDKAHTLTCNDSLGLIFVNRGDKLTWTKHGHEAAIVTNDHYELVNGQGVQSMHLNIKKVTDQMAGIYFCHVYDRNDVYVGRVVKGLNVGGRLYEDLIDKYETNIIVGVIAAAAVFVFVVGICLIDRFRYLTPEQKTKRQERTEERLRRKRELTSTNGGYTNQAMDNGLDDYSGKRSYAPNEYDNTHL